MSSAENIIANKVEPDSFDPFCLGIVSDFAATTPGQREIWSASQLSDDASCSYNQTVCVELKGRVVPGNLEAALNDVVASHQSLRGSITPDGQTFVVNSSVAVPIDTIDFTDRDTEQQAVDIQKLIDAHAVKPFDLGHPPLVRATIVICGQESVLLILCAHHVVVDGWSMGVILASVADAYNKMNGIDATALPDPYHFCDYVRWSQTSKQVQARQSSIVYWKKIYEPGVPVLELPTDISRPAIRSFSCDTLDRPLDASVVADFKKAGAARRSTFFASTFAAFTVLLHKTTGQRDFVLGVPAAGQSVIREDMLVGHCTNMLPIRISVDVDDSFATLLERCRNVVMEAMQNQHCSYTELLPELKLNRDASRPALVPIMLNVDRILGGLSFADLTVGIEAAPRRFDNFEWTANIVETEADTTLSLTYNRDLFSRASMECRAHEFENLLALVAAQPDTPLNRLSILPEDALTRQLQDWNATNREYASGSVVSYLSSGFALEGSATAVCTDDESLSYAELEQRSNALAHYLRDQGAERGTIVGLHLERSPQMLVALLGILKSGAAYLPLDPGFPPDRLTYMLQDSAAPLLVSESSLADRLPGFSGQTINLDSDWPAIAECAHDLPDNGATADDLAYVIYTSGSTGKPKGVQVNHGNVVNFLHSMAREPGIDRSDRLLAVTTLSFDISVLEMFLPLSVGATVVVADQGTVADGGQLLSLLETQQITMMQATPATWRLLLSSGWTGNDQLKVLCGGEALPRDLAAELISRTGEVWNMYGPTETTVWSTCYQLTDPEAPVLIGRPIDNTQVYVLDTAMNPVPEGVYGELFIGGDGVTPGYLDRPELNAERFIADPFRDVPGARLYRTGDLVRYRPDGMLEYGHRIDNQVKVRGFRIELGEIESALADHDAIGETAVIVREDQPGDQRLVAYYVVGQHSDAPTVTELRKALRKSLPDYMVPQHFMALERIPKTPNNKTDRNALPAPGATNGKSLQQNTKPETDLQQQLWTIWSEVLGTENLGIDDDFFEAGGHSLLMTQVMLRINTQQSVKLSLQQMFAAPTVRQLATAIDDELQQTTPSNPIEPVPQEDPVRLSFTQERIWYLQQLDPQSSAYNIPFAWRLIGKLDEEALQAALENIVHRHDVFRTTFALVDDQPVQVADIPETVQLNCIDSDSGDQAFDLESAKNFVAAANRQPFDMENGPLFRATLIRLHDEEHLLALCLHHTIFDGWSLGIFHKELLSLYASFANGEQPLLERPAIQYRDFSRWHRNSIESGRIDDQIEYWREQLKGQLPVLELPTDHPRPAMHRYDGATIIRELPPTLIAALDEVAKAEKASRFMVLYSAFVHLLTKLTGQDEVMVGTPIANRDHPDVVDLIGFFANTLVLRGKPDEQATFRQCVAEARKTCLGAYANQDVPFERLVEELNPDRNTSRPVLYQAFMAYQDVAAGTESMMSANVEFQNEFVGGNAQADFSLWVVSTGGNVSCAFEYCQSLFNRSTVERWFDCFVSLLSAVAAQPEQPVKAISLLPPDSLTRQLQDWNATNREYASGSVVSYLSSGFALEGSATAVCTDDESLSYAELEQRSNALAHYLRDQGAERGTIVGLHLERSPQMLVALLGILKSGAAYLPLDPGFPPDRLTYMLQDSAAPLLVSESSLADRLPGFSGQTINLDSDWPAIAECAHDLPDNGATADDLAYVIYTSGSTGKPKGVQVNHGNVVNFLHSMAREPGIDRSDRLLAVTTLSFDISVLEMFLPLSVGATVVVADQGTVADGGQLLSLLETQQITMMQATPATWRLLLSSGWTGNDQLKVLCGGEALPRDLAAELISRTGEVWNMYGPTETTVWSTCYQLTDPEAPVLIGRPIDNTQVYVLDTAMNPVPEGVYGELFIGGDGVTPGYLDRPELNAERFIADPFRDVPGARLYRTGDLVRYRPDGMLEYGHRIDNQVKVRGFRIELGEIESALADHDAIGETAVIVREDQPGDQRLVAYYVVGQHSDAPTVTELRKALRKSLPDYMVPQHFMALERIPKTPNNKTDRNALPAPGATNGKSLQQNTKPETDLQQQLWTIWSEVLGTENLGIDDDFFEAGGHSLLMTQVMLRINTQQSVKLSLQQMFEAHTIRQIASVIDEERQQTTPVSHDPIEPVPQEDPVRLSFTQERIWYLQQLDPQSSAYNIPFAWRLIGKLDEEALRAALENIVHRHDVFRTTFALVDDQPVQIVAPPASVQYEYIDAESNNEITNLASARAFATIANRQPFNIEDGSLFRVTLIRLDGDEFFLAVCLHHTIFDGWSLGIFHKELLSLYASFANGEQPLLERPAIQYRDFSRWHRNSIESGRIDDQIEYWREQLKGQLPVLELPTDHPRPAMHRYDGATIIRELPPTLIAALDEVAKAEKASRFMVLYSAFVHLLTKLTGQDEVMVGTPIANRDHPDVVDLIGFFANTLVLRGKPDEQATFRQCVAEARKTCLGAYANQDVPFERLVEELNPDRNTSRPVLYQAFMAYQDVAAGTESMMSANVEFQNEFVGGNAQADFSLWVVSTGGNVSCAFEYCQSLFNRSTVERWFDCFVSLLSAVAAQPEQPVKAISLLPPDSLTRQLQDWNATNREYASGSVVSYLSSGFALEGSATAVCTDDESLSYAELEQRSNALAHYLRDQGAERGTIVGLHLERSPQMLVALLGILKSGAAYLPLDPGFPPDRLTYMLQDSAAPLLVSESSLADRLPGFSGQTINLDSDWPAIAECAHDLPDNGATADDLAYVIYTSGSTGKPKGVQVNHGNVVNFLHSMAREPGIDRSDRLLAVTTLSFDISVLEMFLPLSVGATVVVADQGTVADGGQLLSLLETQQITMMQATPATWRLLLSSGWTGNDQLKVLCGGEALPRDLAAELISRTGEVWNMYGPTETTVWSTCYQLTDPEAPVLIGRPIDNTQVYVLDTAMNPVPEGVYGELFIGGDGVTPGYLDRPELNAERFIADPFRDVPGARLYRTGDLVRYRPDGMLEYGHRIDNQVKVRGFRIELGEIESALADHDAIGETAVIVREDQPGDQRLVAYYVVGQHSDAPTVTELRKALRKSLPDYMVPQHFMALERIPKTPNNKTDRNALPAPGALNGASGKKYEEPQTELERQIAGYWSEVLNTDKVGRNDNFFDLGGHSLLSMQIIGWTRRQYGVSLYPLTLITDNLAQIASYVASEAPESDLPGPESKHAPKKSLVRRLIRSLTGHRDNALQ